MNLSLPEYQNFETQNNTSPFSLLSATFRTPVEQLVSKYTGKRWTVKQFRDMNDFSSHPSAIFSNEEYSVFVKLSQAANGLEQFETELAGLRLLSKLAGVLTPTPIGNIEVESSVIMVLEAVQAVERTSIQWREIGRTLAQIHRVKGNQYGLDSHNYFGPFYQDNRHLSDWATFYAERRLWPRLMGAINAGHIPTSTIQQVEKLISRLPELCGPEVAPTLLHGDAQHHNFISTAEVAVVIDPAVYYGHPEIDLAYIDYFHPMPEDVFLGYQDELSIDPGFHERRDLWRVYGYLAAVEVAGAEYLGKLMNAVQKYL
ncbi:MAG: fructosamine kinase family protein [Chloroflexota bacterium]